MTIGIPAARVLFFDPRTGLISREWYQYLLQLQVAQSNLTRRMESGSEAPTTNTWTRGDIVLNTTPSAGGPPGWVCVADGTPGTWKAIANLVA